jgi:methyltransferase (TIGR00027 family)
VTEPALRSVSDTALLVAVHRARESERGDALFHDAYARALAGERGEQIAREMAYCCAGWPVVARTVYFDAVVTRLAAAGEIACVLNLAAGLDARPYRLDLPSTLRWIEVDLPDMLDHKTARLAGVEPCCTLERVPADLTEDASIEQVLDHTGELPTLVLTEGLLVYLHEPDVVRLCRALAARPNLRYWLLDVSGASALRWGGRGRMGRQLASANATHRWAPEQGPEFFRPFGWAPVETRSSWHESARLGRLPLWLRAVEAITPRGGATSCTTSPAWPCSSACSPRLQPARPGSAEAAEEGPHVADQQVWLLHGREVAAALEL